MSVSLIPSYPWNNLYGFLLQGAGFQIHLDNYFNTFLYRDRATAEECLQHPWLEQSDNPACRAWNRSTGGEASDVTQKDADSTSEKSVDTEKTEEEESIVTEELIVVASYTLGQCRQSEKEKVTEQKAISKRFKFEEPLLQEIPGEFIY